MPRQSEVLSEKKKMALIEAAVACFVRKGFHQSSMRDIAAAAGVSLGNLYNYFSGKDALIDALAVIETEELLPLIKTLEENDKPSVALNKFVKRYLDYLSQIENVALSLEFAAESMRTPSIANSFKPNREKLESALSETIAALHGRQKRRQDTVTARLVIDMIEGTAIRKVMFGKSNTNGSAAEILGMLQSAGSYSHGN